MRARIGRRKILAGGAALAVVAILLLSDGGAPLVVGRAPTAPDPIGLPPGGPLADLGDIQVLLSPQDLAADGLDSSSRAPVDVDVYSLHLLDDEAPADVDHRRDALAELDPTADGETRSAERTLPAILLAIVVLKATLDQDRDRRQRALAEAEAPAA
jgi:hypothetical protein